MSPQKKMRRDVRGETASSLGASGFSGFSGSVNI